MDTGMVTKDNGLNAVGVGLALIGLGTVYGSLTGNLPSMLAAIFNPKMLGAPVASNSNNGGLSPGNIIGSVLNAPSILGNAITNPVPTGINLLGGAGIKPSTGSAPVYGNAGAVISLYGIDSANPALKAKATTKTGNSITQWFNDLLVKYGL